MYTYWQVCVHANLHTHPTKVHSRGLVTPPLTHPQGPRALPYNLHTWWYTSTMLMGQGSTATSRTGLLKMVHDEVVVCVQYINTYCSLINPNLMSSM